MAAMIPGIESDATRVDHLGQHDADTRLTVDARVDGIAVRAHDIHVACAEQGAIGGIVLVNLAVRHPVVDAADILKRPGRARRRGLGRTRAFGRTRGIGRARVLSRSRAFGEAQVQPREFHEPPPLGRGPAPASRRTLVRRRIGSVRLGPGGIDRVLHLLARAADSLHLVRREHLRGNRMADVIPPHDARNALPQRGNRVFAEQNALHDHAQTARHGDERLSQRRHDSRAERGIRLQPHARQSFVMGERIIGPVGMKKPRESFIFSCHPQPRSRFSASML